MNLDYGYVFDIQTADELFEYWMSQPEQLPVTYQEKAEKQPLPRVVCDYIAGMTDRFALDEFKRLFEPYERV